MAMSYLKVHYDSFNTLKMLNFEEMGRLFYAIMAYATEDEEELPLLGNERFVFQMMKAQLDRDKRTYNIQVDSGRANGPKGGRPRKQEEQGADAQRTPQTMPEMENKAINASENQAYGAASSAKQNTPNCLSETEDAPQGETEPLVNPWGVSISKNNPKGLCETGKNTRVRQEEDKTRQEKEKEEEMRRQETTGDEKQRPTSGAVGLQANALNKAQAPPNPPALRAGKSPYGEYANVFLTTQEVAKLSTEVRDWEDMINRLSCYMQSTGKRYKDHMATLISWVRKDEENDKRETDRTNRAGGYPQGDSGWDTGEVDCGNGIIARRL